VHRARGCSYSPQRGHSMPRPGSCGSDSLLRGQEACSHSSVRRGQCRRQCESGNRGFRKCREYVNAAAFR
jgi:hypothetical protein